MCVCVCVCDTRGYKIEQSEDCSKNGVVFKCHITTSTGTCQHGDNTGSNGTTITIITEWRYLHLHSVVPLSLGVQNLLMQVFQPCEPLASCYTRVLISCRGTASSGGGAELSGFYDASHYEVIAASRTDTRQRTEDLVYVATLPLVQRRRRPGDITSQR